MAAPQRARLRSSKERVRDYALFVVLVGPNVALLLLFVYRPLADNIRLSFFDWNVSDPSARFVGLSNYTEWFTRSDTRQIVFNTAVFTGAAVVGSMVLGLALAMLLDRPLRGRNLVRSTVFAPFVISGAAVGLAAQFVFDPHFGLIQDLLRRIGVGVPDFYQDARWALFMVTITYVWKNLGYTFVIYLAALQGVRRDLLEAAEIDGASRWAVFRRVLLPQLRPTTFFLSITVLINSLQVFDVINVMTRGGPEGTGTTTMVYQVYVETFRNFRAGYGATVATIMFLVLLAVTYYQVRVDGSGAAAVTPDRLRSSVGYAAMLLVVTLIAGPLLFVFFTSFKDQPDIYAQPTSWWPLRWYPQNYRTATEQIPFWTFLRNSLIITSVLAVVKFTLGVLSAFGLVFVRFPGRTAVFLVIIAALMVPNQITVISNYALISHLGLRNTFAGIILPLAGVAFGTFLMRNHFLSLPAEIIEAARMDGARWWQLLLRVVLPMSRPTMVAVGVITVVNEWNEYLWPFLMSDDESVAPLPIGLTFLQQAEGVTNWGPVMAVTLLAMLPILLVFIALQRQMIKGLTSGAVKG